MANWKEMTPEQIVGELSDGAVVYKVDEVIALDMFRHQDAQTVAEMADFLAREEIENLKIDFKLHDFPRLAQTEVTWVYQRLYVRILMGELEALVSAGLVERHGDKKCTYAKRVSPAFALTDKGQEVVAGLFPSIEVSEIGEVLHHD